MPVEFLSEEEASAYGVYRGVPSQSDLEKLFFLDDADRRLIAKRRGAHNRLGFALLLTTVRYLGLFLPDPLDVPDGVVEYLAGQLEIPDPGCVKRYTERRTTRFEHAVSCGRWPGAFPGSQCGEHGRTTPDSAGHAIYLGAGQTAALPWSPCGVGLLLSYRILRGSPLARLPARVLASLFRCA